MSYHIKMSTTLAFHLISIASVYTSPQGHRVMQYPSCAQLSPVMVDFFTAIPADLLPRSVLEHIETCVILDSQQRTANVPPMLNRKRRGGWHDDWVRKGAGVELV